MTRKEIREFGQHIVDKVLHKKEENNIIAIKGWLARDKTLDIHFYREKPIKEQYNFWEGLIDPIIELNDLTPNCFPEVKWEDDEPTPCEIIIKIEK